MLSLIKSWGQRFNCTLCVLPIILELAVFASYLNPQRIEAPHQINHDLTSGKQFCELHGMLLQPDVVRFNCATVMANARNPFPHAQECEVSTELCGNIDNSWARVSYCPQCRQSKRWENYKRIFKISWQKLFS